MLIDGACHCGNVRFLLTWEPAPAEILARACDCSFCTKHRGVWTSNPNGRLRVEIGRPARINEYAFGTQTAVFHVCAVCGVVPVATSEIGGRLYAVVNVNTFEGIARSLVKQAPTSFDGETVESRLARRTRNWIGDVQFERHSVSAGPT